MGHFSKKLDEIIINNSDKTIKKINKDNQKFSDIYFLEHLKEYNDNLVYNLKDEHINNFTAGDGKELNDVYKPAKMKSFFSSSALAVNAFSWINKDKYLSMYNDKFFEVSFEKQLYTLKSIKNKDVYANLDVYLEGSNTLVFIESKFSEAYTKKEFKISESYLTPNQSYDYNNYDINIWRKFILEMKNKYNKTYFDLQQNIKHLIGIYNHIKDNKEYEKYNIILLNIIYDALDTKDTNKDYKKYKTIEEEFKLIQKDMLEFITNKLNINNFKYELMSYSHFINNYINDNFVKDYMIQRYYNY